LQDLVAYKAADAGIATPFADPAYARACSGCAQIIGSGLKHCFTCNCDGRARSDVNAASNHALLGEKTPRADVTRPYVEEAHHVGL
jgi:transposase